MFIIIIAVLGFQNRNLILYAFHQAKGQINVIIKAKPIDYYLNDPLYPDSLKSKIKLIQEIKKFSVDSLNLKPSKSYEKLYDQKGVPLIKVLTASPRYKLEAKKWNFPIIGEFDYIGFFNENDLNKILEKIDSTKWDTRVGNVSAWSTLGYLNDPILSDFLNMKEGRLAELIIHELTHGTVFIKNNLSQNENLADFVGAVGAEKFLIYKYGNDSKELLDYRKSVLFDSKYRKIIIQGASDLNDLYNSFSAQDTDAKKDSLKNLKIANILLKLKTDLNYSANNSSKTLNNAYFVAFLTYQEKQNTFQEEFQNKYNSNLDSFINDFKK